MWQRWEHPSMTRAARRALIQACVTHIDVHPDTPSRRWDPAQLDRLTRPGRTPCQRPRNGAHPGRWPAQPPPPMRRRAWPRSRRHTSRSLATPAPGGQGGNRCSALPDTS
jgi:hypothetical protein